MASSVLVVEDDADGQEILGRMLIRAGIPIELTSTAEDALQILSPEEHSVVVIDLALPNMNGFDLLQHIRDNEATAHLDCIAITAFHTPALRQRVIESGFDEYFAKPIDDRRFMTTIKDMFATQHD
ncbi:MAG: response regulator [Anaerolineae bacterium]